MMMMMMMMMMMIIMMMMFQITPSVSKMDHVDPIAASETITSSLDAVDTSSFNDVDRDCFFVTGNSTTPGICINDSSISDSRLRQVDYYYYDDDDDAGWNFIDIYYSKTRFTVETTIALLSMTFK